MRKTSERIDWVLFVFALFLGWLGIDKFWYAKTWKNTWKFALVKFIACLALVGLIWWIFDVVMVLLRMYEFDARDYFA